MPHRFIRVPAEVDSAITHIFTGTRRAGVPTTAGGIGTESVTGDQMWMLSYEWPEAYTALTDKAAKESQHMNRFIVDVRAGTGEGPYEQVEQVDADPPDFHARDRSGAQIGVDACQLMVRDRAEAGAQFRPFRLAVLGTDRNRFRHLRGHIVYATFDTDDGRAPKGPGAPKQLAKALTSYRPPHHEFTTPPAAMPADAETLFSGGALTSDPLTGESGNRFSQMLGGWDLVLAQRSFVKQSESWDRLLELVKKHDKPSVDEIVVSAQAPTETGIAYPSDSIAAQAVFIRAQETAIEAKHIRRIYVHIWSSRCVFALTPEHAGAELICGELPMKVEARPGST